MSTSARQRFRVSAIIITAVVLLLLFLFEYPTMLFGLLLIPCAYLYVCLREKREEPMVSPVPSFPTIEAMVSFYGDPDYAITADATRANEPSGTVFCYYEPQVVVAGGTAVLVSDITEIALANTSTPYTVGSFQLVIHTRQRNRPMVKVDCGRDAAFASAVVGELFTQVRLMGEKARKGNTNSQISNN